MIPIRAKMRPIGDRLREKNKENKGGKKEFKVKCFEREEFDFHFDEELDQEVPTGRQNTFSNEW
ncbi:hypothetical protein NQ314_020785 [Rhamnusium bicolor]|uniref:Uncharacterized protein n=1 Tax=Rhamnusium bicolor TaxID=1586634 RepID=A0AAV8WKB6_9CUCU|nr:hypothetical protein NQ314_020785 [Rhamnusium bicolor]